MFPFNATAVWERLAAPFLSSQDKTKEKVTFFTVVPTIYNRLLSSHPDLLSEVQEASRKAISPKNLRLNISGSAALPTPTKTAWSDLSGGNVLLERYGMTEVGMALSCGLDFKDRVDGSVGWPLPGVEARLMDTETKEVISVGKEIAEDNKEREGEIQLRGPTIFKEYWRNPKATSEEFVDGEDGKGRWFKTGDIATRRNVDGAGQSDQDWAKGPLYFIKGRKSVDIIKTGGEKVSALEVERELLSLCVQQSPLMYTRVADRFQAPDIRSCGGRPSLRPMGTESCGRYSVRPPACEQWKRGEEVGYHGHAESAEGPFGQLQDTAGVEDTRGWASEKCNGQK